MSPRPDHGNAHRDLISEHHAIGKRRIHDPTGGPGSCVPGSNDLEVAADHHVGDRSVHFDQIFTTQMLSPTGVCTCLWDGPGLAGQACLTETVPITFWYSRFSQLAGAFLQVLDATTDLVIDVAIGLHVLAEDDLNLLPHVTIVAEDPHRRSASA